METEKVLIDLIQKSLNRLDNLEALCEEMEDDPKSYRLWIDCVDKLSGVIERLYRVQNRVGVIGQNGLKEVGGNIGIQNAVIITNTAELLNQIEKNSGVRKRDELYLDHEN